MQRAPKPVSMTLNLAPMVDVMMCLIIFFLLASRMVAAEQFPVQLPWAAAAEEVGQDELGQRVTITVRQAPADPDRAEYIVVDWDGRRIVERVLPPDAIDQLLLARKRAADAEEQTLRCVIRADQMVMYQHVEVVLRGCGLAQIDDVIFTANKGLPPESAP
jgi:biopolymer transport protein ExbD